MKWYLAGPMSNIPQFNIPAFDEAASELRSKGYDVLSPAELDSPEVREAALKSETGARGDVESIETWGDMLARDVKIISDDVGGIIFLPDWYKSQGARLEAYVGVITGKKFLQYQDGKLQACSDYDVATELVIALEDV